MNESYNETGSLTRRRMKDGVTKKENKIVLMDTKMNKEKWENYKRGKWSVSLKISLPYSHHANFKTFLADEFVRSSWILNLCGFISVYIHNECKRLVVSETVLRLVVVFSFILFIGRIGIPCLRQCLLIIQKHGFIFLVYALVLRTIFSTNFYYGLLSKCVKVNSYAYVPLWYMSAFRFK